MCLSGSAHRRIREEFRDRGIGAGIIASPYTDKYAFFAFTGEAMCFIHVLLNGLDLKARGQEVKIIIEGAACRLVPELGEAGHPFHQLYAKAREAGLIAGVCQACAQKMGGLEAARDQGLTILADMSGHAGMAPFILEGYFIITF